MGQLLLKFQCGFRKGYNAQNFLLAMLEKLKCAVNKEKVHGTLVRQNDESQNRCFKKTKHAKWHANIFYPYLSKRFNCDSREQIIAKLNAYGFTFPVFNLIHEYLSKRHQKTKINNSYSTWSEILFDSPRFHTRVYFI